ncbi:hypothetical protein GGI23_006341 [Coemansia sp. RSA 2559]|nr:hypothetical protein GGI23_006341 [Coemansia sp. RSA 2559]
MHKEFGTILSNSRLIFTKSGPRSGGGGGSWISLAGGVAGLLIAGTVGLAIYASAFGAGSVYPKPVRDLLREGGTAYMRSEETRDLPKAIECYTRALELLDEQGKTDPVHAPDAAHVTGLIARIASVYGEMGDLDNAILSYESLLQRILGSKGMDDPKPLASELLDLRLPQDRRANILRALGCANMLAETYEARAVRWKRRSIILADPALAASSTDVKEAGRWYHWCLQLVTLAYQYHYNHIQLEKGLKPTDTPPFDPATLPKYFSIEIVSSLFYNAATYFAGCAQYDLAVPLLHRALDLLRPDTDKGKEEGVCRSALLMSHLANAAMMKSDLSGAEKALIDGLALAKKFSRNSDCLNSFVALAYSLGSVYQTAGKTESARVQYRQAINVAQAIGDKEAERLATAALKRV